MNLGHDPYVEKEQAHAAAELTLGSVADQFLDFKASRLKPRSMVEVRRHLTRDWKPLGGLPIKHITRAHIAAHLKIIAKECGPHAADHARVSVGTMFAWAMKEGMVDANPVIATNRAADAEARDRVLSDDELVDVWNACRDDTYGRIVRLLILTGQRREEVGGVAETEINLGARLWNIPRARTKNGLDHDVPLSDPAIEILREAPRRADRPFLFGDGVKSFSGWSKAKQALDTRITSAAPWRLHDIRRTVATRMADLGVLPHVIEAVLNHISGHKAGVAGIYNRATYAAEKRQALDLWGAHVLALIAGQGSSNIVVMRSAS